MYFIKNLFKPSLFKILLAIAFFFPMFSHHIFYYPGYALRSTYITEIPSDSTNIQVVTRSVETWCNQTGCIEEINSETNKRTIFLQYILPLIASYVLACFVIYVIQKVRGETPLKNYNQNKPKALTILFKIAIVLFFFAVCLVIWVTTRFSF